MRVCISYRVVRDPVRHRPEHAFGACGGASGNGGPAVTGFSPHRDADGDGDGDGTVPDLRHGVISHVIHT